MVEVMINGLGGVGFVKKMLCCVSFIYYFGSIVRQFQLWQGSEVYVVGFY